MLVFLIPTFLDLDWVCATVMLSVCHTILLHLLTQVVKLSIIPAENQQTYGGWDKNMESDLIGK